MLSELIEKIADKATIDEWKRNAARAMRRFASQNKPFQGVKASGYYFYVDTRSLSYGLILRGVKPNAAAVPGFTAPIGKTEKVPEYRENTAFGWRTFDRRRKTGRAGVDILQTHYFGVNERPNTFFGLRRNGKPQAFGLADGVAVPVYSDYGFVEWITDAQADELARILQEAGYSAIEARR